jgi:AhpD family alkylhydroperoxidase
MARIQPLPPNEWPAEMKAALAAMQPATPRHPPPRREGRPRALNALGLLARHPALTEAFNTFNGHVLFATSLTPRQRELLVLRVACLRRCDYEWAQHTVLARDAGLEPEEIKRVAAGPDADGWSDLERALVRAADELVGDADVSDETWTALARALDEQQLLDLVFTVGAYDALAMAFLAFRVDLDADLTGHELCVPTIPDPGSVAVSLEGPTT